MNEYSLVFNKGKNKISLKKLGRVDFKYCESSSWLEAGQVIYDDPKKQDRNDYYIYHRYQQRFNSKEKFVKHDEVILLTRSGLEHFKRILDNIFY